MKARVAQIFQGVTESFETKAQWKIEWYTCTVVILCTEWTMTEEIFGAHTQANPGGLVMGRKFGALGNALAESEEKQRRGESGLSPF